MKKKVLFILIIAAMSLLVSCENEEVSVERSIDGVAAYLGYFDGEDIDIYSEEEQMYGALAGKYFKDGGVSIYEFDPDSPSYEFWSNETDTCVDGFVLLYDNAEAPTAETDFKMEEELAKIKAIKFKPKEEK